MKQKGGGIADQAEYAIAKFGEREIDAQKLTARGNHLFVEVTN